MPTNLFVNYQQDFTNDNELTSFELFATTQRSNTAHAREFEDNKRDSERVSSVK